MRNNLIPIISRDNMGLKPFDSVFSDMDRLLHSFFSYPVFDVPLRTDIRETENAYIIETEVLGIAKRDISVTVTNGVLQIKIERKEEIKEEGKRYIRRERFANSMIRSFNLPENIDEEKIEAKCEHGILAITLPKANSPVSPNRQIEIR